MSLLKVNDIQRATSGSNAVVFTDPVIITTGSISASVITIGTLTSSLLTNNDIPKEKLTLDARDWVNILNKPAGLITSSTQFAQGISGSSLALADITSSGMIKTTGQFSGSGASLFNIPNAGLVNNSITINGTSVSLGGTRNIVTGDVSESSNLYYTDARVKAKLSTEAVVSSSGQINYQSVTGQPSVNTLGSDGNKSFTISTGIFVTASGGADGIIITNDTANYTLRLRTVGGTVSSSAQVAAGLPADVVSSSTQVKPLLPGGTVSSSAQYPGWVTASSQIDYNSITNKLSGVVSSSTQVQPLLPADTVSASAQVKAFLPGGTVSASAQYPGWITSSTQVVQSLPGGTVSASAQYPGWVTASSQIDVRNTAGIATIATTGSNIFIGNQTMSGSVTVTGNLNVLGSSSILYTTASELIVGDNKIVVNSTDAFRFAGLQIIDSGSASPTTASFYWDGLNHKFIYENLSGSDYNSAIFIAGPKHTGTLGNEPVLATGRVPVATGGDHIDSRVQSSSIRVDFTTLRTDIEAGLFITGSTTASGHIVPSTTDIYDLGSPALKFRSLYLSGSTLYLGTLALSDVGGALSVSPSGSPAGTNSPVSGAFTGSFKGDASQLTNISSTALPGGVVSSSTQLPAGTVSSSAQYPGWVTASSQIDYNSITNKLSGVYSSSTQLANNLPAGTVSSSGQINAGATSNFATAVAAQLGTVHSGSFMSTATTNNLPEGVTNLYYTDARVKTKISQEVVHSGSFLGTATTTNLTEGTNLYFTNARVLTYVDSLGVYSSSAQVKNNLPAGTVSSSTQIAPVLVNSASYAATASLALGVSGSLAVNTDGLNEGSINLYYTDARVKTKLNADNVHSGSFLGTATTTNLTEGTNLYFTNVRVVGALPAGTVSSSVQIGVGIISSSAQFTTLNAPFTGSFTGSFKGDGSQLTNIGASSLPAGTVSSSAQYPGWVTASSQIDYNNIQNKLSGTVSSSAQIQPLLPLGTVSSSVQVDYNSITNKLSSVVSSSTQVTALLPAGTVSASSQIDYNNIQNKLSGTVSSSTQVQPLLPADTVSSSAQVVAGISGQTIAPSIVNATSVTASFSGSGTGIFFVNYNTLSNIPASIVSSSTQILTLLPTGTVSSSNQVDYNSITNKLSGVYSSSTQAVAAIAGQTIAPSIINATGAISGASIQTSGNGIIGGTLSVTSTTTLSGNVNATATSSLAASRFTGTVSGSGNYRMVIPVGTNLYAT